MVYSVYMKKISNLLLFLLILAVSTTSQAGVLSDSIAQIGDPDMSREQKIMILKTILSELQEKLEKKLVQKEIEEVFVDGFYVFNEDVVTLNQVIDEVYQQSYEGYYLGCLNFKDDTKRYFCLDISYEQKKDKDICPLLDPNPQGFYAQEKCFKDVALLNGDRDVCTDLTGENIIECEESFNRAKRMKEICPLSFDGHYPPSYWDCYEELISYEDEGRCGELADIGGQYHQDLCREDIENGTIQGL